MTTLFALLGLFPLSLAVLLGLGLDRSLGEVSRWHPLVGFGHWAQRVESKLNQGQRWQGVLAWCIVVLPLVALVAYLRSLLGPAGKVVLDALALYFAVGWRSLDEHALAVFAAIKQNDWPLARQRVSYLVSRDTANMDEAAASKATVESVLENGSDAIFGAIFWTLLLGAPGAVLFRLANTLDAMWGYKNARFLHFGWAAARIDDVLGYLPARLTALSYAICGNTLTALRCWQQQAAHWPSPNAGPVMSAGAGSLALALGGSASYDGIAEQRPPLGQGPSPQAGDIRRAVTLVRHSSLLWLALTLLLEGAVWLR